MPDGIVPDEDGAIALQFWLRQSISGVLPWKLALWTGALVPSVATVLADLVEPTWSGYSRLVLDRGTWLAPVVVAGCGSIQYGTDPAIWILSGPNAVPVSGWAIVDELVGVLRWIQRFDDPDILTPADGETYRLLPVVSQTNAPC